jgi:hypothetical protein
MASKSKKRKYDPSRAPYGPRKPFSPHPLAPMKSEKEYITHYAATKAKRASEKLVVVEGGDTTSAKRIPLANIAKAVDTLTPDEQKRAYLHAPGTVLEGGWDYATHRKWVIGVAPDDSEEAKAAYQKYKKSYQSRVRKHAREVEKYQEEMKVYEERLEIWRAWKKKELQGQIDKL